ncbi:MAG: RNA methyltransferase [Myxococcales bacterium]|nr:RNA methyltransferase [Myxococcales bacterium]
MIIPIEDAGDPRVADYVQVQEADLVKRRGVFLVEGQTPIRTLVGHSHFGVRSLFLSEKRLGALADVLGALAEETPVYVAPQEVLSEVVGFDFHRGCLAAGTRAEAPPLEAVLEDLVHGPRLVVVLEGIANHDNVGGLFRNAACFGADAVLLDPTCADPLYRKAIRTSLGATLKVPFARLPDWPDSLDRLHGLGFASFALTPNPRAEVLAWGRPLSGLPPRRVLVLGTEGTGLTPQALSACHRWLRIPMAPGADSLNVATASGIAMWAMHPDGR